MDRAHRGLWGVITFLLLVIWCTPCMADDALESIFRNAFLGGLVGGVAGAAFLVLADKPGDHLDYIGYGAAGGVLAGAAYGSIKTTRALAEVDNGKVKLAVPTIVPGFVPVGTKGEREVVLTAEVLRGRF